MLKYSRAFPIFVTMKRILLAIIVLVLAAGNCAAYIDHRGHNLDSLERVVAGWTPEREAMASEQEASSLVFAYYELMLGYRNINGERSMHFARKCYNLASRWNWLSKMSDGLKGIAIIHYGQERYDSALVYYFQAKDVVDRMASGETSFTDNNPYSEITVDDSYSTLYGAMGNCYNLMDSLPKAMEYYSKAGEIFEKYGWNESNAILWYNMGETWYEEGDLDQALACYEKSLHYAKASGDSLQLASAYKGLGGYWLAKGRTARALRYIEKADSYYSLHEDQEFMARIETLGLTNRIMAEQKKLWRTMAISGALVILLLLSIWLILRKMDRLRREKEGADAAIGQALQDLGGSGEDSDAAEDAPVVPEAEPLLTDREEQILPLIAEGLTSPQIADKVFLSLATIKWYRKKLMIKLDAANTAELISKAKEKGLI